MNITESMDRQCEDYFKRYGRMFNILDVEGKEVKENKCIIKEIQEQDTEYFDSKYLITPENAITQGDIIKFLDTIFLVTNNPLQYYKKYERAIIRQTEPINFVFNSKPYAIECIINSKVQDLNRGTDLTLTDGTIQLITQNNYITKQLILGQRFLKYNINQYQAFEIEGIDSISSKGLLIITAKLTQVNTAEDDIINQYANYKKVTHIYSLKNNSGNTLELFKGDSFKLDIVALDNNKPIENPNITYVSDNTNIIVDSSGNITANEVGNATITVQFENIKELIHITIKEKPLVDNYTVELIGNDAVSFGSTLKLNIAVKNNGIELTDNTHFKVSITLENVDTFNKPLVTTKQIINNKQIEILANKDPNTKNLKFKVTVKVEINGKEYVANKIVRIKGLW